MSINFEFKNDSDEAKRAQRLLDDRFHQEFENLLDGWDFAIDLDTLQTFAAQSSLEIHESAKRNDRVVTLALKTKGRPDWPWRIHRLDPRSYQLLEDFRAGGCTAFTAARRGIVNFQPGVFRKVASDVRGIILADSPEKLRPFVSANDPAIEIREITFTDIEGTLKSAKCVLEMIV
jgi:hypothetical protein